MFMRVALAIAIFCLASSCVEAKIIETRHIEDVIPLIDHETLFLVDLDNCMFEGAQALGHANWFYDELQQRMQKGMSREEAIEINLPSLIAWFLLSVIFFNAAMDASALSSCQNPINPLTKIIQLITRKSVHSPIRILTKEAAKRM